MVAKALLPQTQEPTLGNLLALVRPCIQMKMLLKCWGCSSVVEHPWVQSPVPKKLLVPDEAG